MNTQKPEPRSKSDGEMLDFHSMFFTIQGEGPFTGHRAIFIRLAGCNLQCPGCDTEYTEGRATRKINNIVWEVGELTPPDGRERPIVVITGGEPLRQPIGALVASLLGNRYKVQIESNGVFAPDAWLEKLLRSHRQSVKLVVSPKTKRVNPVTAELATAFKYVVNHTSVDERDGLPILALEHPAAGGVARPPAGVPVYVNPYDATFEGGSEAEIKLNNSLNLRAAADSAMKYGYICGTQLHKLLGLE